MTKKVCKDCRIFVEGRECPLCKGTNLSSTWQGKVNIIKADKSYIAKKMGVKNDGEYAIKVR